MTLVAGRLLVAVPGPHQDSADFYGPLIAIVIIVATIFLVRWALPARRRPPPPPPPDDAPDGPDPDAP